MSDQLDMLVARVAAMQNWRQSRSGRELVEGWKSFVNQCERGYTWDIYEFENDRDVRKQIQSVLSHPSLDGVPGGREFGRKIALLDEKYQKLLSHEFINEPERSWWEKGVPRYAGPELVADVMHLWRIKIEVKY